MTPQNPEEVARECLKENCVDVERYPDIVGSFAKALRTQATQYEAKLKGLDTRLYASVEELQKAWEELDNERKARIKELEIELERERTKRGPYPLFDQNKILALHDKVEKLEALLEEAKEALEPLMETAKSYAMQTYDRHGATKKKIEAGEIVLQKLTEHGKGK